MRLGSSWHTRCDLRRPYVSKLSARMKAPSGRVRLAGHRPTFRTSWPIIRSRLPRTYPEQSLQDKTVCYRIDVTVVERTEVAAAASGKAGGFLALDWCVGTPLDALARRSFLLHAELPNVVAGDWGYRRMTAYSGFVVPERDARRHAPAKLTWLSDGVIIASRLGTTDTTAIVHPRAFTAAMMSAAQGHGADDHNDELVGRDEASCYPPGPIRSGRRGIGTAQVCRSVGRASGARHDLAAHMKGIDPGGAGRVLLVVTEQEQGRLSFAFVGPVVIELKKTSAGHGLDQQFRGRRDGWCWRGFKIRAALFPAIFRSMLV